MCMLRAILHQSISLCKARCRPLRAAGTDAFITKFTTAGQVLFSTFLGGRATSMRAQLPIGSNGNIYVAGGTFSTNFPVAGAFQASSGGAQDAFVTQLSGSGSPIFFSSYLGGSGGILGTPEEATGIAVDSIGKYLCGGRHQLDQLPHHNLCLSDFGRWRLRTASLPKSIPAEALAYSTYLGTFGLDWVNGIGHRQRQERLHRGIYLGVVIPSSERCAILFRGAL